MTVLFTADVHAHNFSDFATILPGGRNSRLQAILDTLEVMREYAVRNKLKHLVILGDLFHNQKSVEIDVLFGVSEYLKAIVESGIKVIILAGNHDHYSRDGKFHSLLQYHSDNIIVVDSDVQSIDADGVKLYCVPYTDDKDLLVERLETAAEQADIDDEEEDGDVVKVLCAHLSVDGGTVGSFEHKLKARMTSSDLNPECFDYVLLGHYHKPQMLTKNTYYVGSPIQHTRGEMGERKTFTHISSDGSIDTIPTNAPEFMDMTYDQYVDIEEDAKNFHWINIVAQEDDNYQNIKQNVEESVKVTIPRKETEVVSRIQFASGGSMYDKLIQYATHVAGEDSEQYVEVGKKLLQEAE